LFLRRELRCMTDYFALLEQPRAPWLDLAALKDAYHRKTLQTHPDTAAPDRQSDFAQLNEAYQVLQDPKRRLHHLLSLENCAPPSANVAIPHELQELFLLIGALNQRANALLQNTRATSNALSRSLLKPQMVGTQKEVSDLREKVRELFDVATEQLGEINSGWQNDRAPQLAALSNLYFKFAYLGRWSAQLDELAFQLSLG
jgi:curved DNA-binding protein CbpA